ncbi:MAG TPA: glycosyltransferase [Chloroflexia bacterium]|nr:glycosyltransferase [Chloroflexia bacterium]
MRRRSARIFGERKLRVLHAPANIAGIAGLLARAQRDLGFEATSVEYFERPFNFGVDLSLRLQPTHGRVKKATTMGKFALRAFRRYDVFHLYFGNTLLPPPYPDLPLLRALGKRIVFHFCGCEIRQREHNVRNYALSACTDCAWHRCKELRHPDLISADVAFVSTPDLLAFVPGAHLLPGPVDLAKWAPRGGRREVISYAHPVRIVHGPTNRAVKGTKYLLDAVQRLKSAGYPVEIDLLEGLPHEQIHALTEQADIAVDQLMIGAYGTFSVEMMARGLPVVCRIREDLRRFYPPDLPVINAEPGSIYDVLESLITQPERWADLGRRGIEYVQREHEMHRVAARALSLYNVDLSRGLAPAPGGAVPGFDRLESELRQN